MKIICAVLGALFGICLTNLLWIDRASNLAGHNWLVLSLLASVVTLMLAIAYDW